jgi:hypothetical protein
VPRHRRRLIGERPFWVGNRRSREAAKADLQIGGRPPISAAIIVPQSAITAQVLRSVRSWAAPRKDVLVAEVVDGRSVHGPVS